MNLERFEQNGLELIINIDNGEVFANQNAIARMCNVSKQAISKYVSVRQIESIKAEVQLEVGLRSVNLYSEDAIYQALAKYNPELLVQCAKAGLRLYLHGIAGFKYEVKEEKQKSIHSPAYYVANEYEHIMTKVHDNPRLAQLLVDSSINHHIGSQAQLNGSVGKEKKGVVEIAEEMGFKPNHSNRSVLGRFISKLGFECEQEKRLCNGTMRSIKLYEDTPELRKAIENFFTK